MNSKRPLAKSIQQDIAYDKHVALLRAAFLAGYEVGKPQAHMVYFLKLLIENSKEKK